MSQSQAPFHQATRDDRILLTTRVISIIVIPVLVLAFIILYIFPDQTGQRWAWEIQPPMTALFVGSGYLGGAYFFLNVLLGHRWHRVAIGFPAISVFTLSMLILTLLHWELFDTHRLAFQLWLGLYIATPILVPWVWLRNRITDQGTPEPGDVKVPRWIRRALGVSGALLFILATAAFIIPQLAIQTWPWKLSPLGGRVVSGWAAFVAIGELAMARESRWSAWKTPLESIALWYALIVLGAALNPQDFSGQPFVNWYILGTMAILLSIFALYIAMEARRRVLPVNT